MSLRRATRIRRARHRVGGVELAEWTGVVAIPTVEHWRRQRRMTRLAARWLPAGRVRTCYFRCYLLLTKGHFVTN